MKQITTGKRSEQVSRVALLALLCLFGLPVSGYAAFFQQSEEEPAAEEELPVKVRSIQGASGELAKNLRAYMPSTRRLQCDSPRSRVDLLVESAEEKLHEGAEAVGYYDARFQVTPARQGDCWVLDVTVQPGQPVKVIAVNVRITREGEPLEARDLDEAQELKELLILRGRKPYRQGDVLVHQPYEDYKSSLNRAANNLGFFDAEYQAREILVNKQRREATVNLHFELNERYRIGKVAVEQDVLAPKYLQRYLKVEEGKPYNVADLLRQQRVLDGSSYYRDVRVRGLYEQADDGQIPVNISAERRKRYTYTGQFGYGTDTGFRTEASMDIHWVNDKGHKLTTRGQLGQEEQSVEATYKVPLWTPESEYTSLSGGWQHTDNDDIESEAFKLGLEYHRVNRADWQQTLFISYLDETTQVEGEPETHSQLTLLGARVEKTERDDLLFPTKGWQLTAGLQGAHDALLSDQTLLRGELLGKHLTTFEQDKGRRSKLILRGSAGALMTDDFNEVPKSLRFFAGGQNSVRGYDFESLGETDSDGDVIGGKYLLTAGVEYEHPTSVDNLGAAVFVDTGNAFNDTDGLNLETGFGVGVRYKSPLGPIRADLASPVDDPGDIHFYFSLGPDL